jgi:tRNA 2-thiocytidine biosynthesis protein TtcA
MPKLEDRISKLISKACDEFKLINNGDRVLIGVSGGKDSLTLLYDFENRRKYSKIKFDIAAVHIATDLSDLNYLNKLENIFKELNIVYHIKESKIMSAVKEGKTFNCFWCASQRRKEILSIAKETGFNKIALAHNLDDFAETFFLNLIFKSELSTMKAFWKYDLSGLAVIRPLILVKEELIKKLAVKQNYPVSSQVCPYSGKTKRAEIKNIISLISELNPDIRKNILTSIKNINPELLKIIQNDND